MLRTKLGLLLLLIISSVTAPAAAQDLMQHLYRGELTDPDRAPISGTFEMGFALYENASSTTPFWSETRYVSVVEGMYELALGRAEPLSIDYDGRTLTLAVSLGPTEILRQEITLEAHIPPALLADEATIRRQTFADLAGRSIYADNVGLAQNCRTLSGTTLGQLDRWRDLDARLDELRREIRSDVGPTTGDATVELPRIGGEAGNPYEVICPRGYVMVGVSGGAGNLIDGVRPICARLE